MHYNAKADNARYAASLLWNLLDGGHATLRNVAPYGGTPDVAITEAFRRESAFALESMIKAVVALRISLKIAKKFLVKVRPSHDVVTLWADAELPKLSRDDYQRLLITTQILIWAGRYAAPLNDLKFEHDAAEIMKYDDVEQCGVAKITTPRSFTWDDFDRIYSVASTEFWKIHASHRPE